jgi:hypothetical protein
MIGHHAGLLSFAVVVVIMRLAGLTAVAAVPFHEFAIAAKAD